MSVVLTTPGSPSRPLIFHIPLSNSRSPFLTSLSSQITPSSRTSRPFFLLPLRRFLGRRWTFPFPFSSIRGFKIISLTSVWQICTQGIHCTSTFSPSAWAPCWHASSAWSYNSLLLSVNIANRNFTIAWALLKQSAAGFFVVCDWWVLDLNSFSCIISTTQALECSLCILFRVVLKVDVSNEMIANVVTDVKLLYFSIFGELFMNFLIEVFEMI